MLRLTHGFKVVTGRFDHFHFFLAAALAGGDDMAVVDAVAFGYNGLGDMAQ